MISNQELRKDTQKYVSLHVYEMYYCHVWVLVHVISVPLCVQNTWRSRFRKYYVLILKILGDLADAVRDYSLKFGLYHSLFEWFNPLYKKDEASGFKTQNFVKVCITWLFD